MKVISTKAYEKPTEDELWTADVTPTIGGHYNLKIYTLKKGQKLPLHYHPSGHSEHFYYVKKGVGVFTIGDKMKKLVEGEAVHVPSKELHAIIAAYGDLVILALSPKKIARVFIKDLPKGKKRGSGKWRCIICGYIVEGKKPPLKCRVCGRASEDFDEI